MKKEELILKYKKSLSETKGIFESLESEFKYVLEKHGWIADEKIEKFCIKENGKYFVFGEGNVALISEELITNYNPIFESSEGSDDGSFLGKIWDFIKSGISHAYDLASNNLGWDFTKITLMIAGFSELISIVTSFLPAPVIVSLCSVLLLIPGVNIGAAGVATFASFLQIFGKVCGIVAGLAFIIGGVSQLIESKNTSKDLVYNESEIEKEALKESVINEGAVPYNSPTFENGLTHFIIGIVSLAIAFVSALLSTGAFKTFKNVIKTSIQRFFTFFTKKGFKLISKITKEAIKRNNDNIITFFNAGVVGNIKKVADKSLEKTIGSNFKKLTTKVADEEINKQLKQQVKDKLKQNLKHNLLGHETKHAVQHGVKHVAQANVSTNTLSFSQWSITFVATLGFFFKDLFKNHKAVNEDFASSFGNNILKIIKGFNGTVGTIINKIKESLNKVNVEIGKIDFDIPWIPKSIEENLKKYSVSAFSKITEMLNVIISKMSSIIKFFDECLESVLLSVDVYNENNFESANFEKNVEDAKNSVNKEPNKKAETITKLKERIKTLGKISFDSNKSEKKTDENGTEYLVVTDIKTSKKYGVIRNSDGTYKFRKSNKTKKNESFTSFENFKNYKMLNINEMKNNKENEKTFLTFKKFNNELLEKEKMNEGIGATIYNWSADAKNKIQLAFFTLGSKLADKLFKFDKDRLKKLLDDLIKQLEPSLSVEENNILKSSVKGIKDRIQSGEIVKGSDLSSEINKALGFKI